MVADCDIRLTPEEKRAQLGVIQAYGDFWNQSMRIFSPMASRPLDVAFLQVCCLRACRRRVAG